MNKSKQILSPLKEEEPDKKKPLRRGNSLIHRKLMAKNNIRYSLDVRSDIHKKNFLLQKNNPSPVDLCLFALNTLPKQRDNESLQFIISYLKSLSSFMNIISKEKNLKLSENLIEQISIHLRHEYIPKNNLVCRFGERGEKFYIILKGKITFLVPKPSKCYLNLEEYIVYLMQLRKNNEFELIDNLLVQNRIFYPIEDDDLDRYILNEYERYLKRNGRKTYRSNTRLATNNYLNNKLNSDIDGDSIIKTNIITSDLRPKKENPKKFFSLNTYKKMEELVEKINHPRLSFNGNNFSGENSPKYYMRANNVANTKLESKGRKLIHIYTYEEMSTFENGQTFGFIALQSKNCKRAATAIVVEDSNLGVLTKDEYSQFFEIMSNREKKNLYDLLKSYNLITTISEYKFIKRYYHMFEYIKFRKNNVVMDTAKEINDLIVFSSGLFVVTICVNIQDLNELITKLKIIRGKLLGLSKQKIESQLDEKRENQDIIMRKNYISPEDNKILLKKRNYTLSIISDHLIIGYPDTVDPVTHLPLFNCNCLSAESDGYIISNRSINLINEESTVIHNLKDFCLMKIDYNLNRLQQFKKEVISKTKKNEIVSPKKEKISKEGNITTPNNIDPSLNEKNTNVNHSNEEINYFIERNQLFRKKSRNNNKLLLGFKINSNFFENTLYKFRNDENKNNKERERKLQANVNCISSGKNKNNSLSNRNTKNEENSQSKTHVIKLLRASILKKQKRIELKKEQYYKAIEDINNNKKEKIKIKESINTNTIKDIENNDDSITNRVKSSLSQNILYSNDISKKPKHINKNKIKSVNAISYKILNRDQNNENLLTLPPVESKRKMIHNYNSINYITECDPKMKSIKKSKKKNNRNDNDIFSYEDIFKKTSLSPSYVKDHYIIFKSPNEPMFEVKKEFKSKIKLIKNGQIKKEKDVRKDNDSLSDLENDKKGSKIKEYVNKVSSTENNDLHKKDIYDESLKQKCKELNTLIKSLQKTTNEILERKNI